MLAFYCLFCRSSPMSGLYDFEALSLDGQPVPLSQYRGQVLLIVNTASA